MYNCSINLCYERNRKVPGSTHHSNHPQTIYYTMGVVTHWQKCSKTCLTKKWKPDSQIPQHRTTCSCRNLQWTKHIKKIIRGKLWIIITIIIMCHNIYKSTYLIKCCRQLYFLRSSSGIAFEINQLLHKFLTWCYEQI